VRRRRAPRGSSELRPREVAYSQECLERLARILVHSGHSPAALAREFREICSTLKETKDSWDPLQLNYWADLPHVIAHWHADPQYVDSLGVPIPLPLQGKGPSLFALARRVLPSQEPAKVVKSLLRLHGVRRNGGRYVPTGRSISYSRASGRVHGLLALLGMLRTVERNVSGSRSGAILERAAMNPNFPVAALPAFHRRLKPYAAEFLWGIDGDMRRREMAALGGPRTRLGVCVFAFEEPGIGKGSLKSKGRRARAGRVGKTRHRGKP
jgi:hypothetical protein